MMPIHSPRLTIRAFTLDDAPFILRLLNEPSYLAHIPDKGVRTLDQAVEYLRQGPLASYATHGHGLWMVQQRETGVPMGRCGIVKRDSLPEADLGYAFAPEFWGQGLAREAAAACLEYARVNLGMPGLMGIVSKRNEASNRLLLALGFVRTGSMEHTPGDVVEVYRISFA
jgi:[ribosomal protein S5]-alanine N-acetyltransferase